MPPKTNQRAPRRRSRRRKPSPFRLPTAVLLLVLTLLGGRSLLSPGLGAEPPAQSTAPFSPTPTVPTPSAPMPTAPMSSAAPTPEPVREPAGYDYASPVPEAELAAEDWFSDAAFVGDSLTDGLLLYSGIRGADNLSYKGLTVQSARTDRVIKTDSGKKTPLEALAERTYGKVYLLLGVNELGWYNDERFYRSYGELVDLVREAQPDAQIYLQTLLPVTAEKSAEHPYFNNRKIQVYNDLIAALAEEKEVYLLDTHAAFADEEDALPAEGSTDGIHLTRDYYKLWLDYLRAHTVPQ